MEKSTRRTFLELNAAAATGILAQHIPAMASSNRVKNWRIGIIGATGRGDYGHAVDMAFKKIPEARIAGLADPEPQGREAAAKRLQPERVFESYREMLATVPFDIVAICPRWIDQHFDMLTAAIEAGCHVYMEKPFCPTLEQCDQILRALREKNLRLAIAHTGQYSPTLRTVQKIIADGTIGDLIELRGRGKEDQRGGGEDLWVLGSHILGLMRTIADGNATSCTSIVTTKGKPISRSDVTEGAEGIGPLAGDHVHARYTFDTDIIATFGSR
ncbi:MAG: Gfo/Idh/MocA family oxidoreductase, partial [Planctomycetes bacterium]|nr:Gfo/Idh/MocA family oxidoreductase [Planctomycetota bacterium]